MWSVDLVVTHWLLKHKGYHIDAIDYSEELVKRATSLTGA
ncbi:hypothetical protein J521_0971 [Acinetobacter baumannii 1035119]|nr:hypothetical protein J521_0971 [Acinetobacter baumannii 1035119]EXB70180.1 hypothetical protein J525_1137 [Acinetobacter sp. 21871]EXR64513.1 hypothetical protein J678_1409 [Acinetobacter sp. 1424608]